jgi:hypothetical protein
MKNWDDLLVHIERSSYIASLKNAQRQQSAEPQILTPKEHEIPCEQCVDSELFKNTEFI